MTALKHDRFGRYLILDHLVDGGMAKICRAMFLGEQADKIVAIKMIQEQYSKNDSFKQMFMDELKVTFGLQHPNIVQTFDYGVQNNRLYVAMEYCDGRNLKQYLMQLKEKGFIFPIEVSVHIMTEVCKGLYYAHTLTDKLTGKEFNIVHRDISPHNIMLTFDGAVKIIDFGIAKAETNTESTQAGTIKGKLSYLAPEYLEGMKLDPSYDQFAVGITLWEMLCSRKLFRANNDLAVLKKIQECKVPVPSSINPIVPKELDAIVLKALSKDRTKRFKNLNEMNRALTKFLYGHRPDFNPTDLAHFAKQLFQEEIKKDREKLFEFGKIDLSSYIKEWQRENNSGNSLEESRDSSSEKSSDGPPPLKSSNEFDFGFDSEVELGVSGARKGQTVSKIKIANFSDGDSGLSLDSNKASVAIATKQRGQREGTRTIKLKRDRVSNEGRTRTNISLKVEKEEKKSSFLQAALVLIIFGFGGHYLLTEGPLKSTGDKLKAQVFTMMGKKNRSTSSVSEVEKKVVPKTTTVNILNYSTQRHRLFLNGVETSVNAAGDFDIEVKKNYTLRVEMLDKKFHVEEIYVENVDDTLNVKISDTESQRYSFLKTSRNCAEGTIEFKVFGENRTEVLPLNREIPLPVNVDLNGKVIQEEIILKYTRKRDGISKDIALQFSSIDQVVDFCEI